MLTSLCGLAYLLTLPQKILLYPHFQGSQCLESHALSDHLETYHGSLIIGNTMIFMCSLNLSRGTIPFALRLVVMFVVAERWRKRCVWRMMSFRVSPMFVICRFLNYLETDFASVRIENRPLASSHGCPFFVWFVWDLAATAENQTFNVDH